MIAAPSGAESAPDASSDATSDAPHSCAGDAAETLDADSERGPASLSSVALVTLSSTRSSSAPTSAARERLALVAVAVAAGVNVLVRECTDDALPRLEVGFALGDAGAALGEAAAEE